MTKRALITGVGGQDGSYLAQELLDHGWEVHGLYRHSSISNLTRICHLLHPTRRVTLHRGDVTDYQSVSMALVKAAPDVVFHEADQDNVGWSKNVPAYASEVTYGGTAVVLEAMRRLYPRSRVFVPCSATVFGSSPPTERQHESTPFAPESPYAVAKVGAYYLAQHYRREYGMHVSTGILYNHDSPVRTEQYLLHKLARSAVRAANGGPTKIALGNLEQVVDIGYAPEFVAAVRKITALDDPGDYVVGTGRGYTVGDLAARAVARAVYVVGTSVRAEFVPDPVYYRADPGAPLVADCRKLLRATGWEATTDAAGVLDELVDLCVRGDLL